MLATFKLSSRTVVPFLVSCSFCLMLLLVSGCGTSFTPAEQAEVDKYIKEYGRNALARYLRDVRSPDEKLVLKYVRYFVSQGADVNADNNNPLAFAARTGHLEMVKFLVSKGADAKSKKWALHDATAYKHPEIIKYLESVGAKLE